MAISRAQLLKELLPGLNALFGMEYARYGEEHKEIYETEKSERSFEEETKLAGFSAAPVKNEGSAIQYDNAQEAFTARYTHETIALGFSITEEAMEGPRSIVFPQAENRMHLQKAILFELMRGAGAAATKPGGTARTVPRGAAMKPRARSEPLAAGATATELIDQCSIPSGRL